MNLKSQIANASDPRHQALMVEVDRLYRWYNDGLPCPDMGRTAKALHEFLRANPAWPLRTIQRAMRNRYDSEEINYSEAPWIWLKHLPSYVQDPLNRFKQPVYGRGDKVFRMWEKAEG
jgi:hypothetical protein